MVATCRRAVGRTLAVTTAWRLLYDGELTAQQFVDCAVHVLRHETADSVIEPLVLRLVEVADLWAPPSARDGLLSQVADLCASLAGDPDRRVAALRGLANSATTRAHLDLLTAEATDADLRWRRLTRLAELDRLDDSEVDDLLAEDPNPDAWMSALQARTARPSADAKAEAWQVVVEDRKIPPGVIRRLGRSFWRPGQEELVDAVRREVPGVPRSDRRVRHGVGAEHVVLVLPGRRRRGGLPPTPRRRGR